MVAKETVDGVSGENDMVVGGDKNGQVAGDVVIVGKKKTRERERFIFIFIFLFF